MSEQKNNVRVVISKSMADAVRRLPQHVLPDYLSFQMKFMQDPTSPGLNYEKLQAINPKLRSARVNLNYRAIILVPENDEMYVYTLLWVDKHDNAYDWARRKKIGIVGNGPVIQLYDVAEQEPEQLQSHISAVSEKGNQGTEEAEKSLFSELTDDVLVRIGVPRVNVFLLRRIRTEQELDQIKHFLPMIAYERLYLLLSGYLLDEVLEHGAENIPTEALTFEEAIMKKENRDQFYIVEPHDDGLDQVALNIWSLDDWRIFLHPMQRKFAEASFSGPAKVLGEAGTGKTVVAMHRAKHLVDEVFTKQTDRILFTTFTSTLAEDIAASLKAMCAPDSFARIDICNIDKWVASWLTRNGYSERMIFGQDVEGLWNRSIDSCKSGMNMPAKFYAQEYEKIVLPGRMKSFDEYRHANRSGMGTPLNRTQKGQVWKVMECYASLLKAEKVLDPASAAMFVEMQLRGVPVEAALLSNYRAVVLDEAQDLGSVWYLLIRAIAGDEHPNDIFIVGDTHQRIYGRKVVLKECGINTVGRSGRLRVNYRSTEAIRKVANEVIRGMKVDDLDAEMDEGKGSVSLKHGKPVLFNRFSNAENEQRGISEAVKKRIALREPAESICIMARNSRTIDGIRRRLESDGIRTYEIKNRQEDRTLPGVRLSTMHRAKGLEFDFVILAGLNDGLIPLNALVHMAMDKIEEKELVEKERSLLYTAITRARNELLLTCSGHPTRLLEWKEMQK